MDGSLANAELDQRQLSRLLDVGRALVSELDLETLLKQVLEAARDLTGARYAALGILDDQKHELDRFIVDGIDDETRQRIGNLPRGHGILGELIRDPQPLRLERISDHPRSYGFPVGHPPMTSFLGVPVMVRGEAFGNLYLTDKGDGAPFEQADEELVVVLSEWAAIAIENARLYEAAAGRREELERAVRGLEATASLSRDLGGESDLERVLELVAKRARALVDARAVLVLLIDGDELTVAESAGEIAGDMLARTVNSHGPLEDVLRAGASQRRSGSSVRFLRELEIDVAATLLVPLRARGRGIGVVVAVDRLGSGPEFTSDDELVLNSFASAAASAVSATQALETEKLNLSLTASERERGRWARELHDETLQELGALKVAQEGALQTNDLKTMRAALLQANAQVERVIGGLEGLITELRPAALDQIGTQAAIEALVARLSQREGLHVEVDFDLAYEAGREPTRPSPELEATIYRIVQEALNNVVKHAEADSVRVAVAEDDSQVRVIVEDDGKGLEPSEESQGFGLIGMRERVILADGELVIATGTTGGTRITATLPVIRREASAATI